MSEILLADDDLRIRKSYRTILECEGYAVRVAKDGDEALALFKNRAPDLLLLDVMMPRRNGIAVCEEVRKSDRTVPILFFTALPSDVTQVRSLGLGADDYIDKADGADIVLARVRRALDRTAAFRQSNESSRRRTRIGDCEIDFDALSAIGPRTNETLTRSEADVLYVLSSDRDRLFTRDEIFEVVRGSGSDCTDNTLSVHISRLRRKLGAAGDLIVSERGIGYKLLAEPAVSEMV